MLRSTGFFRGIDCPFYSDYSDGKGGKNGCNRPYCHFRHSRHRLLSYGAAESHKELQAAHKEQGYDPFKPEVVHPPEPQNDQPAPSGDITGALALVNRAIEEVRSQMEREKRKLSRIGDEPYDPSENASVESVKCKKVSVSHMAYDPSAKTSLESAKSKKVSASHMAYDPCENVSLEGAKSKKVSVSHMTYDPSEKTSLESKKVLPSHMAYDPCENASLDNAKSRKGSTSDMAYEPSEKTSLESAKFKKVSVSHMAYDPCENASLDNAKSGKGSASNMVYEPSEKTSLESVKSKKVSVSHMAYDPCENASLDNAKSGKGSASNMIYEPSEKTSLESVKSKKVSVSHMAYDPCENASLDNAKSGKGSASKMAYEPSEKTSLESVKSKKVSVSHMAYDPCENASLEGMKTTKVSVSHMTYDPSEKTSLESTKSKKASSSHMAYDPCDNTVLESTKSKKASSLHMTYDPGSYQMTSAEYNPSPGCSKYMLDSNAQEKSASSMEYVPTSMKKSTARTQKPLSPSSPKYSNSTSSAKSKYTLDITKPSTDMEYDPLSNYSASIAGKSKKEEISSGRTNGNKSSRVQSSTEEYVVSVKKPPQTSVDSQKYTISDSDGECSSLEYKPTSISNLQLKKDSGVTDVDRRVKEARTECVQNTLTQRNKDEVTDLTKPNHVKHKSSPEKRKLDSGRDERKTVKESGKSNSMSSSKSSGAVEKTKVLKTANHNTSKKENKSNGKKEGEKSRDNLKTSKEGGRDERRSDLKVKSADKVKADSSNKRHRDSDSGGSESKKAKLSDDKEKNRHNHKNGKLDSSKSLKDLRIEGKTSLSRSSSNSKGTSSKDKVKNSSSSPRSLKKSGQKERSLSLSHADLFGDESPEEAEPMEVDNEEQEEEMVVRKCAEAVKRRLNKRKASSSEDESDCAVVSSRATKEDVESLDFDLSSLQDDLDFESDPLEECLRIFNESNDVKKEDKGRQAKQASRDSDEEKDTDGTLTTLFPGQKKRVSHCVAKGSVDMSAKAVVRPYKRPSAQEVCYQRMQLAQQQAAQLSAAVKAAAQSHSLGVSGEKKRIAHRPNPQVTANRTGTAKAKPDTSRVLSPSQSQPSVRTQTTAGILSKTSSTALQKRVAHMPTLKSTSMKRPVIPTEFGAKVPTNVRQRYLNNFIDECVKFCPSEQDAFQMALDEEKVVYERSNSKNIYLNVAVNTLKKLRSKSNPSPSPVSKPQALASNKRAQSHEEVLGGRLAATTSFTVNRKGKQSQEKLCGATLYHKLKSYLMSEEQLQEHGYPRKDPESSGRALLYNVPEKKAAPVDPFNKICCRCGAEYMVSVNGNCVRKEECNFHWGRLRRHKVSGGWETSYSCCSGAVGTPGCQVCKQHVQDGRKESLEGFVSTFSKPVPADGNAGVFALDCEMCYTKQGLELSRVTVIDSQLKVIYDTFVKPASKVVDYNTRFSGVTEEDLENVSITLRDVQAVLLSMFNAESILLGHSLESDLLALKLIHSTVVDTAIVFPHRLGLPYKRALRNLMADHLKRIIQDSVGGHDSSEDASACMELMMWKIKEDAKVKR